VAEDNPPARAIQVHLPEPLIAALDAYGKKNGTGRGKSITALLEKVLDTPEVVPALPPVLPAAQKSMVRLEMVKRSNPLYVEFRQNHYIENRGVVGQQLQYLIFYGSDVVGVIGGASAVYANQARDEYFGLSDEKELKVRQLNSIVNNNIFRLTAPYPNLASIVLSKWQKRICKDWYELYGIKPCGLETFVIQERLWDGRQRDGACYRAAGWDGPIGISKGYSNKNVRKRKITNKYQGSRKLVYCKRIKGVELNTAEYETAWGNATKQALLDKKRKEMFADPLDLLIETIRN